MTGPKVAPTHIAAKTSPTSSTRRVRPASRKASRSRIARGQSSVVDERKARLRASDALLAVTTLSFDIAALELFLPCCRGGAVIIADARTMCPIRRARALIGRSADHHAGNACDLARADRNRLGRREGPEDTMWRRIAAARTCRSAARPRAPNSGTCTARPKRRSGRQSSKVARGAAIGCHRASDRQHPDLHPRCQRKSGAGRRHRRNPYRRGRRGARLSQSRRPDAPSAL